MLGDREKQKDDEDRGCAENERCELRGQHPGRSANINQIRAYVCDRLDPQESICAVTFIGQVKPRTALRPCGMAISFLMHRRWRLTSFSVALIVATIGWLWFLFKVAEHFLAR
jgi:hypothetical protein